MAHKPQLFRLLLLFCSVFPGYIGVLTSAVEVLFTALHGGLLWLMSQHVLCETSKSIRA